MSLVDVIVALAALVGAVWTLVQVLGRWPIYSRRWRLRYRARRLGLPEDLPNEALALAVERPPAWEYLLFEATLSEEIEKCRLLERDVRLRAVSKVEAVTAEEFAAWVKARFTTIMTQLEQVERLAHEELPSAVGEPGESGDAGLIVEVGRRMGRLYRDSLEHQIDGLSLSPPEEFKRFANLLVDQLGTIQDVIRSCRESYHVVIRRLLETPGGGDVVIRLKPDYDFEALNREIEHLRAMGRW